MKDQMIKEFKEIFGGEGECAVFFSPGRVNLIGEHTDYNGGHVFPCALTIGTYAAVRKRDDNRLNFCSKNFPGIGTISCSLENLVYDKANRWANYCLGVIWAFVQKGYKKPDCGFDFYCFGNIPNSSGLSSSASLELLMAKVLIDLYDEPVEMKEAALLGQYAENEFVGLNCGIMDQFAIAMGRRDNAIFLDTATLEYQYVPVKLNGLKIVIGNTNKKRGLCDSKYNERRSECEQALAELQTVCDIKSLGDLSEDEFEQYKHAVTSHVNVRRARHAVYENARTVRAVAALKNNDLKTFGNLMNASHASLRDDYEVTGKELNTLVESAWQQMGVVGARMTGAGFGGCTVSIVRSDCVDRFIENVGREYKDKIGYEADFYVVDIGDGPSRL